MMVSGPGERQGGKLTREEIEALLYGGRNTPRFTQDSPILPDVWIKYAEEPLVRHELLLTPYQEPGGKSVTAGQLCKVLKALLGSSEARRGPADRPSDPRGSALAYNQSTVYARLWFDELVRVVLPLSAWWHRLGESHGDDTEMTPEDRAVQRRKEREKLLQKLRSPDGWKKFAQALKTPTSGSPDIAPDVVWMVHIIGTIWLLWERGGSGTHWWPKDDEALRKLSAESSARYDEELARHHLAVVDRVIDLTTGLEDAPKFIEGAITDEPMVWSVSLNRQARSTIWRSRATVKGDAAIRLFDITCRDLAWAVIDSGINARHEAFRARKSDGNGYDQPFENGKNRTRIVSSYDFSVVRELLSEETLAATAAELPAAKAAKLPSARPQDVEALKNDVEALKKRLADGADVDWELVGRLISIPHTDGAYRPPTQEHGTHVAGILAGDCRALRRDEKPRANPHVGLCPDLQLYDLRVLNDWGEGHEFNVMAALQFVRYLNSHRETMVVHGVNLSLSIRHDIANFACGRTPVCEECERLVGGGIVVVTAAGNDGYLQYLTPRGAQDSYRSISITDPGNAAGVITVGSTHRFQPHTYGISYFSSRGPTGDGRAKPDLVAPGEKIEAPVGGEKDVKRMDGTSMAAPHVSGAAALLIARHRELAGQPARIKQVLCATATDLGRERYFQGAGLVDILRALQSV